MGSLGPSDPTPICSPAAEGVCISTAPSAPCPSLHTQEHPQIRGQNCRRKAACVGPPGSLALPALRKATRAICTSS